MAYADLDGVFNPSVGAVVPIEWLEQIRENFEFVVDPPRCSVVGASTTTGSSTVTWYTLDQDTELFDTDGIHSGSNDYLQIVTPGTYMLGARVNWEANGTGNRAVAIILNDNASFRWQLQKVDAAAGSTGTIMSGVTLRSLAASDQLKVQVLQNSTVNLECTLLEFYVRWIGR